jgi:hypothetical protein
MTRDDIIRMARESGFAVLNEVVHGDRWYQGICGLDLAELERFAALVSAKEREACAKVCEEQGKGRKAMEHYAALTYSGSAHDCAAAIRARGEE